MRTRTSRRLIQVFAKAPIMGRVKSRLARDVGAGAALKVHRHLLAHVLHVTERTGQRTELWCTPNAHHPVFRRARVQPRVQSGTNLGQRMYHALRSGLERAGSVVLIGCDCPEMSEAYLQQAFQALQRHPLVFGPACDGGYVLIGARRVHPALFRGIDWGSSRVMSQTRQRIESLGWSWDELPPLHDLDDASDLQRFPRLAGGIAGAQESGGVSRLTG